MKEIISALIQWVYRLPLWAVGLFMLLGVILWAAVARFASKEDGRFRRFRILNIVLFAITSFAIIWVTLFSRNGSPFTGFVYMPFAFVINYPWLEDAYRTLIMNTVLFFPIGLTMPFVIGSKKGSWRRAMLRTVLFAFLLSLSLEVVQFILRIGLSEVDDLIFNTLGAFLGTFAARIGAGRTTYERNGSQRR